MEADRVASMSFRVGVDKIAGVNFAVKLDGGSDIDEDSMSLIWCVTQIIDDVLQLASFSVGAEDLVAPKDTAVMISGRDLVRYISKPKRLRYFVGSIGGESVEALLCGGAGP